MSRIFLVAAFVSLLSFPFTYGSVHANDDAPQGVNYAKKKQGGFIFNKREVDNKDNQISAEEDAGVADIEPAAGVEEDQPEDNNVAEAIKLPRK